jgi:uncharacterized damage-inducible protein DinB
MSDPILTSLFRHKAWCNAQLVEALRRAPADMDRIQLAVILFTLDHTARVDQVFRAHLEGEAPTPERVVATALPDLETLAQALAETDAWYLDYAGRATPEELACVVDFTFVDSGDPGRMTKGEMLAHVITHGASHRGAIGKMLELASAPGAPDMVTTFVRQTRENAAPA